MERKTILFSTVLILLCTLPACQVGPELVPTLTHSNPVVPTLTPITEKVYIPIAGDSGSPAPTRTPAPIPTSHSKPAATVDRPVPDPPPLTPPAGETSLTPSVSPTAALPLTPTSPPPTPTRIHPVYQGPPLSREEIGLQIHLHNEDLALILSQLRSLDVGWVKVQVSWKLYEPEPGQYDQSLLRELDLLVSSAAASEIYLLLSVVKAPEWSRPTTELDGPPTDHAHYRDFMRFLALRYQGNVPAYELWNEANLRREWNGVPLSAADFVSLIRAGANGVREADPLAIVVSGAPAPTGIHDYVDAVDDRIFLREMLVAGLADQVDTIGAHAYGWANPPDSSADVPDPATPSHNDHRSFFFRDTLWDYYSILSEAGYPEKQVWVTEFGWGSFDGIDANPPAGVEYMAAVSEWQQATYTLRAYELAHEWRWVGPLFLWNLNFGPLLGSDFAESGYSLLRTDGSPRPVYLALQTILD